jgi:1-carboxybiuret hydrolase subunit AtzH-like protein
MEINRPEIVAEVTAAFERYEKALVTNDVATLDELFYPGDATIRFGVGENLFGIDEIRQFRSARSPLNLARHLSRTVITSYGREFATASTLFQRTGSLKIGRQMQTWVKFTAGWRVVAAHVSLIDPPAVT